MRNVQHQARGYQWFFLFAMVHTDAQVKVQIALRVVQIALRVVQESGANCTWSGAKNGANCTWSGAKNGANCSLDGAKKVQIAPWMVQKLVQTRCNLHMFLHLHGANEVQLAHVFAPTWCQKWCT